jgi:hypothetical protein
MIAGFQRHSTAPELFMSDLALTFARSFTAGSGRVLPLPTGKIKLAGLGQPEAIGGGRSVAAGNDLARIQPN